MTDENQTTEERHDPWGIEPEVKQEEAPEELKTKEETTEGGESVEGGDSAESEESEEEKKEEPVLAFDGKPLPKSRRAHEINARASERLSAKDAEIEKLRKELEETKGAVTDIFKKPEEKAPEQTDDEYLISKGYDPEEFLDDGAKKATLRLERKADELDAEIKAVKEQGKKREESENETASERQAINTLNSEITGLPEAEQSIAWDALNHLQRTIAKTQFINWEATKAGRDAIKEHGIEAVQAAAMKEAEATIKKTIQTIVKEGGSPLKWAAQSAKIAGYDFSKIGKKEKPEGNINSEKLEKAQERAGKPAIDTAGGASNPAGVFSKKTTEDMEKAGWW